MYNIRPSSLTDDEFLRMCQGILVLSELPREYQQALADRFEKLLNTIDDLKLELTK
jgi:hypothetical protein